MAKTDIKTILIKMVMLGILVFAIMSWIIVIQNDSGLSKTDRITNNSLINKSYGDLETSLSQQKRAQSALDSLEDIPPLEYVGDLDVASTVSATRTSKSMITGLWNIYIKLPQVILGVSPIIAAAINSVLLILIAIAIWAVWKGAIS